MTTTPTLATPSSSTALQDIAELRELAGDVFVLDLETALAPLCFKGRGHVRLLQVGNEKGCGYLDLLTCDDEAWEALREWLTDPSLTIIGHNIAFDYRCLLACSIQLTGKLEDTMKLSEIKWNGSDEMQHGMAAVARRVLGIKVDKGHQADDWMNVELTESRLAYALGDVNTTWKLRQELHPQILQEGLGPVYRLECALIPSVVEMEHTGLPLDPEQLEYVLVEYANSIPPLRQQVLELIDGYLTEEGHEGLPRDPDGSFNTRSRESGSIRLGTKKYAGFNLGSPTQVLKVFHKLGIEPVDRKTQKATTDKKVLRKFIKHPVVAGYLDLRAQEKRQQMVEGLKEKADWSVGRVFARLDPLRTGTGRFASSGPNLQNLPRDPEVRDIVAVPPGYDLIQIDVSAMEMVVGASAPVANETKLQVAFNEGLDVHTSTAALMFGLSDDAVTKQRRQEAKACFSGDTELLTPDGWVPLSQYAGQPVAQYELPAGVELNAFRRQGPKRVVAQNAGWTGAHGIVRFVFPSKYGSLFSDDVWSFEDRNVSIVATGNHDLLWITPNGTAVKKPLREASNVRHMIGAGHLQKVCSLTEAQVRVVAMIAADGSFTPSGSVRLGFTKRRKIHRCKGLLEEARLPYVQRSYAQADKRVTVFTISNSDIDWVHRFMNLQRELLCDPCLSELDGRTFLEEAQYWDGITITGENRHRIIVSTTSQRSADTMQAMAVTSGFACTVGLESEPSAPHHKLLFRVSVSVGGTSAHRVDWNASPAPPQQVFCVQVPSGLLLVRHKRKVSVQGNCNFGCLYGSSASGLMDYMASLGVFITYDEAADLHARWHAAYPAFSRWHGRCRDRLERDGYVRMVDGRRRFLTGEMARPTVYANNEVQGSSASIIKRAMCLIYDWKRENLPEARLLLQVHDELLLQVPTGQGEPLARYAEGAITQAGREIIGDSVVLKAEAHIGRSWGACK